MENVNTVIKEHGDAVLELTRNNRSVYVYHDNTCVLAVIPSIAVNCKFGIVPYAVSINIARDNKELIETLFSNILNEFLNDESEEFASTYRDQAEFGFECLHNEDFDFIQPAVTAVTTCYKLELKGNFKQQYISWFSEVVKGINFMDGFQTVNALYTGHKVLSDVLDVNVSRELCFIVLDIYRKAIEAGIVLTTCVNGETVLNICDKQYNSAKAVVDCVADIIGMRCADATITNIKVEDM